MKADLDLIKLTLKRHELDQSIVAEIIRDIETEVRNEHLLEAEERPPTVKKQFCVLVSDPEGKIEGDFAGWVIQIPEEDSPQHIQARIREAAADYNISPRGKRIPVQSIGEACEVVPARFFKEHNTWVKTKIPTFVVTTDNKLS
jgi:hypothetical protein